MSYSRLLPAVLTVTALIVGSASAEAGQARGRAGAVGRAAPAVRATAVVRPGIGPGGVGVAGFRPYGFGYGYPFFRPGLSIGFYGGYPYGYWGYPYGYPYGYAYPYPYGYYDPSVYPAPPAGYVAAAPGGGYGSVRIEGAPPDAQVFADGYYVGIVSDFDGSYKHLDLPAGAHRIEVRTAGAPPSTVDVKVEPGQTITYHANAR